MFRENVAKHQSGYPTPDRSPTLMVVAGEASSDEHTAGVVRNILALEPGAQVFGMGGAALSDAGMELVVDSRESASVMGLTELFGSLRKIRKAYRKLVDESLRRKPDLAILVDFPDFNLRLARVLHRRGIKILYFISPQLWAWRRGRVRLIKKYVNKVVPIFPFEESFYHQHGVDAEYLGHPFLDRPALTVDCREFLCSQGLDPDRPVLALLPGSRKPEVRALLEPMMQGYRLLKKGRPGLQAVIPIAPTLDRNWVGSLLRESDSVALVSGQSRELLSASTVAVVASGTATVDAALAGVPFVVTYKLSPFTFAIGRLLVKGVRHVAMANLIAGRKIVEELLQEEVTGERIAFEVEKLLGDRTVYSMMKGELQGIRDRLNFGVDGSRTVGERVAEIALELADKRQA